MDDFPMMVYRWPAQSPDCARLQDGNYDALIVADDAALEAATADGFFQSMTDARGAGEAAAKVAADAAKAAAAQKALDDAKALIAQAEAANAPPSRADLEAKAADLGVTFKASWSDKKLADAIAVAQEP